MLLRQAENLWTVDRELPLGAGVRMPIRMTVVRLPDGSLVLVSPVPIDDALGQELYALGPVGYLVAPNRLHHLSVPAAARRYPEARVLGVDGVAEKQPSLRFEPLDLEGSRFAGVLEALPLEGAPNLSETVLFHPPSRTLVVTDFVFNVVSPSTWATSLFLSTTGTRGKLAQSRVWSWLRKDAALLRRSTERIFEWDFDRLIMAHGNVVETGARRLAAAVVTRAAPGLTV